jgi:hypothetical protein
MSTLPTLTTKAKIAQLKREYGKKEFHFEQVKFTELWPESDFPDAELNFCKTFFGEGEQVTDKFLEKYELDPDPKFLSTPQAEIHWISRDLQLWQPSPKAPMHWLRSHFMWRLVNLEDPKFTIPELREGLKRIIAPEEFAKRLIDERDEGFHAYILPELTRCCLESVPIEISETPEGLQHPKIFEDVLTRVARGDTDEQIKIALYQAHIELNGMWVMAKVILIELSYRIRHNDFDQATLGAPTRAYPLRINFERLAWILCKEVDRCYAETGLLAASCRVGNCKSDVDKINEQLLKHEANEKSDSVKGKEVQEKF